ncbi:glycosyltransferase family 4 protein [Patescibacteria group bacterium]|nr:glycosyltransferase family 4 protein [Patescibacteria group bacterium]
MKILHVISTGYLAGGAETLVLSMQHELQKRGHEVKVLSSDLQGSGKFSDYEFKSIPHNSFFKVFHHLFYIPSYRAMRKAINDFRPDLIHFHTLGACSPSVLFAARNIPAMMTIHGPEEFIVKLLPWFLLPKDYKKNPFDLKDLTFMGTLRFWFYRYIQRPLYLIALRRIKIFIASSRYITEALCTDVSVEKIIQIYNGIELPVYKPLSTTRRVLYVGRLEKIKGVDYLLRAFVAVLATIPQIELHIVGDGAYRCELEILGNELGLTDRIVFHGWIQAKDILREYEAASLVVIPSIWPENFPTVCLEAFAVGRPVIGTTTGGIPELIEDGKTGYLVPPKDAKVLSAAIRKILGDKNSLIEMGRAAATASTFFSVERFVDQLECIYEDIFHEDNNFTRILERK